MDRRAAAAGFRDRLERVIARTGESHSGFARLVGVDRSTLTQLLSPDEDRLPRAETLAAIATGARVSVDWLLGLSQREQLGADVFGDILQIATPEPSPIDARMFGWMTEASGYKIRSVPSSVPDVLKTEAVIRHQYAVDPERTLDAVRSRLAYLLRPETEIEVCCAVQTITGLARGEGVWADLPVPARIEQLVQIERLSGELYPSLRLFLFDLRETFSVPFTVFGIQRAALYLGGIYFVFNSNDHIRVLTRRFDDLVRAAVVQPPDVPRFVRGLLAEAGYSAATATGSG
jgi:transcriptional regulator with XRE-family HTH domain